MKSKQRMAFQFLPLHWTHEWMWDYFVSILPPIGAAHQHYRVCWRSRHNSAKPMGFETMEHPPNVVASHIQLPTNPAKSTEMKLKLFIDSKALKAYLARYVRLCHPFSERFKRTIARQGIIMQGQTVQMLCRIQSIIGHNRYVIAIQT